MTAVLERHPDPLGWLCAHPIVRLHAAPISNGFDVRGRYVELFWLPILGPTAVFAARRFADLLDVASGPVDVELVELAASLGVGGGTGRNTAINRTIARLSDFGMAHIGDKALEVETHWPVLPPRLHRRLPSTLASQVSGLGSRQEDFRAAARSGGVRPAAASTPGLTAPDRTPEHRPDHRLAPERKPA